jgi:hypothetical protein
MRILPFSSLTFKKPKKSASIYYFLKVFSHHFSKIKIKKKPQNSINQGFSYYSCLMIEGSGSGFGSIPPTNGSGSRRPKNMWIRRIRIQIRIRIPQHWSKTLVDPGSGSTSQRYGSGSGSFYHHAKIVRQNLDSYYFVTLFDFLS